ncbi:PA14 domain-containing protein [Bacillus thuringiensis]|uniref:PA14 domain-containing protein n=1 Tax=Bacillus thuringiensis TaxID=1428 RepID=UPI000BF42F40|nr:PA14 domain-containing protein [Bacillus thuringiensis]PEV23389.1 hypothetical protein CN420_20080 [Bacillus thuringiensis]WLP67117.1 PA14 domain-containing protein [Bacillus thuringiensis]
MSKAKYKRNAIHSGIGDNDDLFTKSPQKEDVVEDFQYAARLRGKKKHETMIYPEIPFEYGISYDGRLLEKYNEKPYQFEVNAHPEKTLAYEIEETKELPVKRLWEAKACFEAEVWRLNMQYSFNWKGHTGIRDKRTAEYAVDWKGMYKLEDYGDVKDLFTSDKGIYIGYNDNQTTWHLSGDGSYVLDGLNRPFFSGVISRNMMSWNAYETEFDFKCIKNDGAGIFGQTLRYDWSTGGFFSAPCWDDDVVGLIFQAKDPKNFYMMLWEAEERIHMSSRAANDLDGIDIFNDKDTYIDRSVIKGNNSWSHYCDNMGWGKQHKRIYKVTNGVMRRVWIDDLSNGFGWTMFNMHGIKIKTNGSNVQIFVRQNRGASYVKCYDFNTEWGHGSFGMLNVSQAVEFHGVKVTEYKIIEGRIPESGWYTTDEPNKRIADVAAWYVDNDAGFRRKCDAANVRYGDVDIFYINGYTRVAENGTIDVAGRNGPITVHAKDYTTWKDYSGRFPQNYSEYFEFNGIGDQILANNAQDYVSEKMNLPGFIMDDISGQVVDPKTGTLIITGKTGQIIARNNNPPDAGKKYAKCYVRCGIVEVTPDHRDFNTALVVFDDIKKVFRDDYNEFFNREDYINKKEKYELVKPVKKPKPVPPDVEPEESDGGCRIDDPVVKPPDEIIDECWDDFDFDGIRLVMWSCTFPIEKLKKTFEEKVFAYNGWVTFNPLASFKPNKWTYYKMTPIEATINPKYDKVKWANRDDFDRIPVGTKVIAKTTEWYKAIFPADIKNSGIITSDKDLISHIPPCPEHFYHPIDKEDRMPDTFEVIHFLLDAFSNSADVVMWYESNPTLTTESADKRPESLAQEGKSGMPIVLTSNENDNIVIHCKENPRWVPWSSGKYIGYGKVNGKRPFFGDGSGKADMVNVSTEVVFFPDNLDMETLKGPFIDIYDKDFPNNPRVKYKLNPKGTKVDFFSNHTDAYNWYTDWYSNWVESKETLQANMSDITVVENPLELNPYDSNVAKDYDPDNTFIERIEVTSNNEFIKVWIEEKKGKEDGLFGSYYRFPLTSQTYEQKWQVQGDYQEWTQSYEIKSYMDKIEIPVQASGAFKILYVKVGNTLISQDKNNGWTLEDDVVILHGSGIRPGTINIKYATGSIHNVFQINELGSYKEIYLNGILLDNKKYEIKDHTLTINKDVLNLYDWVHFQSYHIDELHDPTKRNYLGEKKYTQLDFQEDIPIKKENPNYNDPFYEGSLCFNWGYRSPKKLHADESFSAMSMFLPEDIQFDVDVDMEVVYPVGNAIDISNFTGEWKQWDQHPDKVFDTKGNHIDGPGDWHGPPEKGYDKVINLINQGYYSGWYNPKHVELKDYAFSFKVESRTLWDDDLYGCVFRFNPETCSGYSFEWDAGGAGINGMAIYKLTCKNPDQVGKGHLNFSKVRLAHDPEWWDPDGSDNKLNPNRKFYPHDVKISVIGNKFQVYVDGKLKLEAIDKENTYKSGAWGPITFSNPDTYFWNFWLQTYKRVTPKERPGFRKHLQFTKKRKLIEGEEAFYELELDEEVMREKFEKEYLSFCQSVKLEPRFVISTEYFIRNDASDYEVYFKEFQKIRVLELSPSVLEANPLGHTSIQEAVKRYGNFDISKNIEIVQDVYQNWNKYKVEDFDVLTFTPADCNAGTDFSDDMIDFVRKFKASSNKVIIFSHDTISGNIKNTIKLLEEFGFKKANYEPYTRGDKITLIDPSFNYPYPLTGTIDVSVSHWNQCLNGIPIYKFAHENRPWLSYVDNVYYSEAGDSTYYCDGRFRQQLSDNEMKIWVNLMCRIAQWKPSEKPKMTAYGQSKLFATVRGQNPPIPDPNQNKYPSKNEPTVPVLQPPKESDPNDGFTVSWNGYIYAPQTGYYRFKVQVNDGFRLWIADKLLINEWHITSAEDFFPSYEASVYMEGGKWYPIRANFFDNVGQAVIRLHWSKPGKDFERIHPKYLTPYLGYKLFAQVKKARPLPWHLLVHNGYYYHQEREHYLYAEKKEYIVTPDKNNGIMIQPRPQQGCPIIVQDNQGNTLRKVTFYDDNWNLTLENKEVFHGNGYAKYYLNYKGIDKETLKVYLNGSLIEANDLIFHEEVSAIEFMKEINVTDIIEVRYILLYSYILDINANLETDSAQIILHNNYEENKMKNMRVIYESAKETPFYRAKEIVLNPLLTHNHTGFLYLSETGEQDAKTIQAHLSDKIISNSGKEKVLVTVSILDKYNNPCPNKIVKIYRDDKPIDAEFITNEAGEVYIYDTPAPPKGLISIYRIECNDLRKELLLNYYAENKKERLYIDIVAPKLAILSGVDDYSTIKMTLRDSSWNPVMKDKKMNVEYRDTHGNARKKEVITNDFGQAEFILSGLKEKHGEIMIKVSYDMGFEQAASYVYIKVIGG